MSRIGITTTIPIEIIYAAGMVPVDLNNIFITSTDPLKLISIAEEAGFPRNTCGWIKGIYGAITTNPDIKTIIAVTEGDCSNTHALAEIAELIGKEVVYFSYPIDKDKTMLQYQMHKLMSYFGISDSQAISVKKRLDKIRQLAWKIDQMTWKGNISGKDNHYFLVNCSDMKGNPDLYKKELLLFINNQLQQTSASHSKKNDKIRIGIIGVPPIFPDFFEYIESLNTHIVYNEIPRQFSMPFHTNNLIEQYLAYTYPYGIFQRLSDIKTQITNRKIDGVIHYVQAFCFRHIEDIIVRQELSCPVLTIEGDTPINIDARTRIRIETFIQILKDAK